MLPVTMARTFGDALRTARERAGFNQADLAKRMKLSPKSGQSNIAALENRQFPPKRQTVLRIVQAMPIDINELLDDVMTPWGLPLARPRDMIQKARAPAEQRPFRGKRASSN